MSEFEEKVGIPKSTIESMLEHFESGPSTEEVELFKLTLNNAVKFSPPVAHFDAYSAPHEMADTLGCWIKFTAPNGEEITVVYADGSGDFDLDDPEKAQDFIDENTGALSRLGIEVEAYDLQEAIRNYHGEFDEDEEDEATSKDALLDNDEEEPRWPMMGRS